jgi:hypothetical protein
MHDTVDLGDWLVQVVFVNQAFATTKRRVLPMIRRAAQKEMGD